MPSSRQRVDVLRLAGRGQHHDRRSGQRGSSCRICSASVKPSISGMWPSSSTSGNGCRLGGGLRSTPSAVARRRRPACGRMRQLRQHLVAGCGGWWRCRPRPAPAGRAERPAGPAAASAPRAWPAPNARREVERAALAGSLSTQMRPPISSTSCVEMVRPSPVPPYLRVVEPSACAKASKISPLLVGRDADAGVAHREVQQRRRRRRRSRRVGQCRSTRDARPRPAR